MGTTNNEGARRGRAPRAVPVIAALALVLSPACSYMFVRGPSSDRRHGKPPHCNSSGGSFAFDGLAAVTGLTIALAADDGEGVTPGLIGTFFATSAIYGYTRSSRCDRARLEYEAEVAELERDQEREAAKARVKASERARAAAAAAAAPPPVVIEPPPPAPPPAAPPKPPPVSLPGGLRDPFAPAPPTRPSTDAFTVNLAGGEADDAGGDEPSGPPDDADDATDDATDDDGAAPSGPPDDGPDEPTEPDDLEARWREFWRRLP